MTRHVIRPNGPKVIEYNCRFGDPETQVVLPLLKTDLLTVMKAVRNETLSDIKVEFKDMAACCVVMASRGYPGKYETGFEIKVAEDCEAEVYVAGAKLDGDKVLTAGGRVLGVVAVADDLISAVDKAYKEVPKVTFDNAYYRSDIGQKAIKALK